MSVRLLTPTGRGGLAVVEVRGPARSVLARLAGGALDALLAGATTGSMPRLVRLRVGADLLDEALVWRRDGERIEVGLHGGPAVVQRLLVELEAASRDSGDSLEERAWRAASRAPTEAGARLLVAQARGALRRELERRALDTPREWEAALRRLLQAGSPPKGVLEPLQVVLAGPTNAGKSTLFNVLVGSERTLVSEEPGTTRDFVVERTRVASLAVDLADAAGERAAATGAERRGLELAQRRRRAADLVLWLHPAGAPNRPTDVEGTPAVRVLDSRADEGPGLRLERPLNARDDPRGARELVASLLAACPSSPTASRVTGAGIDSPLASVPLARVPEAPVREGVLASGPGEPAFVPLLFEEPHGALPAGRAAAAWLELGAIVATDRRAASLLAWMGERPRGTIP